MANPPKGVFVSIQLHVEHVALITLNKPATGNSLHPRLVSELLSVMNWANGEVDIHIIFLTGSGRFFCTGMDLSDSGELQFGPGSDFHRLNEAFIKTEKILVAAVNGPAAGYGVSVLALFDLVYANSDAYFFTPFVKWGMAAEGASSYTFPRMMGLQKAAILCLAGESITASEAFSLGLVFKVLPSHGFLNNVMKSVEQLALQPYDALKTTKALMRAPIRSHMLEANDRECRVIQDERLTSEAAQKARTQFQKSQALKRPGGPKTRL